MRSAIALSLLLVRTAAEPRAGGLRTLRRELLSTATNFKPNSEEMIDHILDQGEAGKPGHKGKKANKVASGGGVTEVQREKMKEMGEYDVHVSLAKVAEQPYEQLGEGASGKVDQVLKAAEKESKVEKKMKQAAVKQNNVKAAKAIALKAEAKHPELTDAIEKDEKHVLHERKEKKGLIHKSTPSLQELEYNKEYEKKLVMHKCPKVREFVAFLVPTTERQMEHAVAMLLSFDRMGHGKEGDLKFIFQSEDVLNTYVDALPKLFRKWNASDTNARRLLVELKENAIIHGPVEMPNKAREMAMTDSEGNARFLKACKRLHALAYLLDKEPCNYKYSVFATPESRFLPLKRVKAIANAFTSKLPGLKKISKLKIEDATKKPLAAVVRVEDGRRLEIPTATGRLESPGRRALLQAAGGAAAAEAGDAKAPKSAKKREKQAKKEAAGEKDFDVSKLKSKAKAATAAGDAKTEEKVEDKLEETKAAKKALKDESSGKGNGLVGGRLISRFDQQETSKVMYAQNCNLTSLNGQKADPGLVAARSRMENNAYVFSGGDTDSPRYARVQSATRGFDLFTLQGQLPVVEMKAKASRFLLEVFRASGASPTEPITTFGQLVTATLEKIPSGKAKDFSDVLQFQYYLLLRGGYQLRDASSMVPGLPSCSAAAPLLDAAALIVDKGVMKKYSKKIQPLMVPVGFNGLGQFGPNPPLMEYDRPDFDYTDGESIY